MGKSGTYYKVRPLAEAGKLKLHVSMMPMELQAQHKHA